MKRFAAVLAFVVAAGCAANESSRPAPKSPSDLPDCDSVAHPGPTSGSGTIAVSGTSSGSGANGAPPSQAELDAAEKAVEAQGRLPMGPPPCRDTHAPAPSGPAPVAPT